ncbi:MAG: hypothetical protein IJI88_04415 [Atopobiaceae bacterium]|nr:hypothetical protein [Atopobiaceae bacterium]
MGKTSYDEAYEALLAAVVARGLPPEFGQALAAGLGTENAIRRMTGYLHGARPRSMVEIADEMVAICEQRDRWVERKKSEYYQAKVNEFYNRDREDDQ